MSDVIDEIRRTSEAVERAANELLRVHHFHDGSFINLPVHFPDGSQVTVRVAPSEGQRFSVTDHGFAYRQLECVGAQASWSRIAKRLAGEADLDVTKRLVAALSVSESELIGAICDVAAVSWQVVNAVYGKLSEERDSELEDRLFERLQSIFGAAHVKANVEVAGSSSSQWDVTALVTDGASQIVFQAVSPFAQSVYRTNTAFHDIALKENAPTRVAVVRDKSELGARVGILAQAGRVIEAHDPDAVYRRAAS